MDAKHEAIAAGDEGFGMIEIVVSMFMLSIIAIAFLPLLISSLQLSARNATLATATQLVNEQMDAPRLAASPTCSSLLLLETAPVPVVTERGGDELLLARDVVCPTSFPGLATFRASVTVSGEPSPIAEASTVVYVRTNG